MLGHTKQFQADNENNDPQNYHQPGLFEDSWTLCSSFNFLFGNTISWRCRPVIILIVVIVVCIVCCCLLPLKCKLKSSSNFPVTTRADHGNWAPNRSCTNGYSTVWRFSNWQRSNKVWSNILDFSFRRLYYGECVEWGDLCCKSMLSTQKSIRSFLAFLREPSGAASAIQLGSPHLF